MKKIKEEITLLETDEVFGKCKLKIFDKKGLKAALTDYSLIRGGGYYLSNDSLNERTGNYFLKNRASNNIFGDYASVSENGKYHEISPRDRFYGVRPIIHFSQSSLEFISNLKKEDGIVEVEYGKYPQYVTSPEIEKKLEKYYNLGLLEKTGIKYTTSVVSKNYFTKIKESERKRRARYNTDKFGSSLTAGFDQYDIYAGYEEYLYQDKKYIKASYPKFLKNKEYEKRTFTLSNQKEYQKDENIWLEVSPIKWYLDFAEKVMVSKNILTAGIKIDGNFPPTDFRKTLMYDFLNNYFASEIVEEATIKKNKSHPKIKVK